MRRIFQQFGKKLKASLTVEATVAFPIFVVVFVTLILSYRIMSLEAITQVGIEQANLQFSAVLLRAEQNGFLDDYFAAGDGMASIWDSQTYVLRAAQLLKEDRASKVGYTRGEYVTDNVNNKTDVIRGALARAMDEEIERSDALWCDFNEMAEIYDYVASSMRKFDAQKIDYEEVMNKCLYSIILQNMKDYVNANVTTLPLEFSRLKVTNWKCSKNGRVLTYSADVTMDLRALDLTWEMIRRTKTFTISGCTVLED